MEGETGVTKIETSAASPTVSRVESEIGPKTALMFVVPRAELVARPPVPESLLITATLADEELQVAVPVTSCVVPSV